MPPRTRSRQSRRAPREVISLTRAGEGRHHRIRLRGGDVDPAPVMSDADRQAVRAAYRRRIEQLRECGADEGILLNPASEKDFYEFVQLMPCARQAGLVLTPGGNLRAVWDDDNDADRHLALQFLGDGQVQYVIFQRRADEGAVARVAGTDTFDGIRRQIDAFGLQPLVRP